MKELNHCPSTLADGFSTYSPTACKKLFDGQKVSHLLDFEIDEISKTSETMMAMRRISVSGAQEKFPAVIENGIIRISQTDERSRYILKPAPWDNTLYTRKQIPANEHLTMQIASQVYGIITAENGLCFTPHGDMVYIPSAIGMFLLSGSERGCLSMQERCLGYLEVPESQLALICT